MDSKAYAKEHKQDFIAKVVKGKVPVLEENILDRNWRTY